VLERVIHLGAHPCFFVGPFRYNRRLSHLGVRAMVTSEGERQTNMTPEDRDLMIELSKRIARETDIKKLASWIDELNELIQSKIRELRHSRPPSQGV
jgi:DNA replication initiation complex subunit (GINS family)